MKPEMHAVVLLRRQDASSKSSERDVATSRWMRFKRLVLRKMKSFSRLKVIRNSTHFAALAETFTKMTSLLMRKPKVNSKIATTTSELMKLKAVMQVAMRKLLCLQMVYQQMTSDRAPLVTVTCFQL